MKALVLGVSVACIALLAVRMGFSQELSVAARVDRAALPILIYASITQSDAPCSVEVTVSAPLFGPVQSGFEVSSDALIIALPTNLAQEVVITVRDSNGNVASVTLDATLPVFQYESFFLDGSRYHDAVLMSDDVGALIPSREDSLLARDRFVLSAPFSFGDETTSVTVDWPAHYIVESALGLSLVVTVQAAAESRLMIRGMCDDYSTHALGHTHLGEHYAYMSQVGVNAIQFLKILAMASETASTIYDPNPMPNSDTALLEGMRAAKAAGFNVVLRLIIVLDAPWPMADNLHDRLNPDSWDEWFDSNRESVLRYAAICESAGVDVYVFSDTLLSSYAFEEEYRELISAIREIYRGRLAVATGPYHEALTSVAFWDALEFIGINGSLFTSRFVAFDEANGLSIDGVYDIFLREFESNLLPVLEATGKPLLWLEAYYASVERSTYSPMGMVISEFIATHDDDSASETDPDTDYRQPALGYSAMLRVLQTYHEYIGGFFALDWSLEDPLHLWCCPAGTHRVPFTEAEDVFRLWWSTGTAVGDSGDSAAHVECTGVEYAELANVVRGYWSIDSHDGNARATLKEQTQSRVFGLPGVMDFEFANPNGDVLRFRYHVNVIDEADPKWDGVVVAVSADSSVPVAIEVSFSDCTYLLSAPEDIGPAPRLIHLPFPATEPGPGEAASSDLARVDALSVIPLAPAGEVTVYAVGFYRGGGAPLDIASTATSEFASVRSALCEELPLSRSSFHASLSDDIKGHPGDDYVTIVGDEDSAGDGFFAMRWASARQVDLTVFLDAELVNKPRAIGLSLSCSVPTDVRLWAFTYDRRTQRTWILESAITLEIGEEPLALEIPLYAFHPIACSEQGHESEAALWGHLKMLNLFPSGASGELRVHGVYMCFAPDDL